jgi:hypothetical protein
MIPGSVTPLLLKSAAAAGDRSLRFNSVDSAHLTRTPAVAGNRRTWTWAAWVKRSAFGAISSIFGASSNGLTTYFNTDNTLNFYNFSGGFQFNFVTTQVFRDPSAWMHLVFAVDTTLATSTDRVKIYVNGLQITTFTTASYPTQNLDTGWNASAEHKIGSASVSSDYFNGYLTNIHSIDGQQLTPSSFTETDATTGQLIPKTYTGSYGTNGFNLLFADNSSNTASTLGKDTSPNGNNWTPNNLSVTAGAGNDSLVDSPTNYGTDTGVGGSVRGNYCTWNPLDNGGTLANGNLDFSQASAAFRSVRSTFAFSSGKWYWEGTLSAIGGAAYIGIGKSTASLTVNIGGTDSFGYVNDGTKQSGNTSAVAYGASYTTGDVIGVALDADTGTLTFYKNGTSQGQAYSGLTSGPYFMMVTGYNGTTWATNFGQRAFAYQTPGTNRPAATFLALCTQNLPAPLVAKPSTVFDVITYTGTGSSLTLPNGSSTPTSIAFTPDFAWLKGRSGATDHALYDAVRGVQKDLVSNSTSAETTETTGLTAFGTNTLTVGSLAKLNTSSATYVAWAWNAGGSTVSNPDGSITSQVRANATAGFSVVTYTGNNTNSTVGHGLNVTPEMIIVKTRTSSDGWAVYHKSLGTPGSYNLRLNSTGSVENNPHWWNSTGPTSSVFSLGTSAGITNGSGVNYVAYCFSPVVGYSSFGSYVGNGSSDGPFVYTGFRPRWLMIKVTNISNESWVMKDSPRGTYNPNEPNFYADLSAAEQTSNSSRYIDFTSNGFKLRGTEVSVNGSSNTYVYIAFAESPFNYSRAR